MNHLQSLLDLLEQLARVIVNRKMENSTKEIIRDMIREMKIPPNILQLVPLLYVMNNQHYDNKDGTLSDFLFPLIHGVKDLGSDGTVMFSRDPSTGKMIVYDKPIWGINGNDFLSGIGDFIGGGGSMSWLKEKGQTASSISLGAKEDNILESLGLLAVIPQILEIVRPRNFHWGSDMKRRYKSKFGKRRRKSPAVGSCWGSCECEYSHADLKEMMRELDVPGRSYLTRKDEMCEVIDWLKPYGVHVRSPFAGWGSLIGMNGFEDLAIPMLIMYAMQGMNGGTTTASVPETLANAVPTKADEKGTTPKSPEPTEADKQKSVAEVIANKLKKVGGGADDVVNELEKAKDKVEVPPNTPPGLIRNPNEPPSGKKGPPPGVKAGDYYLIPEDGLSDDEKMARAEAKGPLFLLNKGSATLDKIDKKYLPFIKQAFGRRRHRRRRY